MTSTTKISIITMTSTTKISIITKLYESINFEALPSDVFDSHLTEITKIKSTLISSLTLKQVNQILHVLLRRPDNKENILKINSLLIKLNQVNFITKQSEIQSYRDYLSFIAFFNKEQDNIIRKLSIPVTQSILTSSLPKIINETPDIETMIQLYYSLSQTPIKHILSPYFSEKIVHNPKAIFRNGEDLISLYNSEIDIFSEILDINIIEIIQNLISDPYFTEDPRLFSDPEILANKSIILDSSDPETLANKSIMLDSIVEQAEANKQLIPLLYKAIKMNIGTILEDHEEPFLTSFYSQRIKRKLFPEGPTSQGYLDIDRITIKDTRSRSSSRSDKQTEDKALACTAASPLMPI